jgi:DNA adenine methylase
MKPPVRYVGGKSWLVDRLVLEILACDPSLYVEPFLGGGAIALGLPNALPKMLGDVNAQLIDMWLCLQRVPKLLHDELDRLAKLESKENYIDVRADFNAMIDNPRTMWPARAARFLYLNQRCFNGLWRTNASGKFNVPYGEVKTPRVLSLDDLMTYCETLSHCTFKVGDFDKTMGAVFTPRVGSRVNKPEMDHILDGVVIYADPPYADTFDGYGADGFGEKDHRTLAWKLRASVGHGAKVFATNADTPLVREIYAWASIEEIDEHHSVGSKPERRGLKKCLLIRGGI